MALYGTGILILGVFITIIGGGGGYSGHSGFYSGYRGGYHSSCACVCAGSGRAGCSKKDFYGTKLNQKKIEKIV